MRGFFKRPRHRSLERIHHLYAGPGKIDRVSRHHLETILEGGGGEQTIDHGEGTCRGKSTPPLGDRGTNRENILLIVLLEPCDPAFESGTLVGRLATQDFDPLANLSEGENADKMPFAGGRCGPSPDFRVGASSLA